MDNKERLNLDKMIKEYGTESTTEKIRKIKHSELIRKDVTMMMMIKEKYKRLDKNLLDKMIESKCSFLKMNYMNIYNKLKNNMLEVNILYSFIDELKKIEDGECDQHEASYRIGLLLKQIYIDGGRKMEALHKQKEKKKTKLKRKSKKITWEEYKNKYKENISN